MQPHDLIDSARFLANAQRGKPSQANLRRAVSTAYYAMFHCLAKSCADLLVGGANAGRSKPAWRQVYRALDHKPCAASCKYNIIKKFPKPIEDFANTFVTMQEKRHSADYDPFIVVAKSSVLQDIAIVERAIIAFKSAPTKDKRAFCAFVLFKKRV